jgi:hypothetical protein
MLFCADLGILRAVTRPRGESKQDQKEQSASQHNLTGKAAIVTAGGRGIGTAITLALADAGADVALAGRKREFLAEVSPGGGFGMFGYGRENGLGAVEMFTEVQSVWVPTEEDTLDWCESSRDLRLN